MPLTPDEREKARDIGLLANEIRQALNPPRTDSKISDFAKQVILLILGFVLTTLTGGALTAWWKARDSENQRHYLEKQKALDRAYSLISQTSKEVATTVAAADDVLATYEGEDWTAKEVEERRDNWNKTSRNWRISDHVLRAQIAPTFSDSTIKTEFDDIIKKRRLLGNDIINLPRGKKAIEADKNLDNEREHALKLIQEITGLLYDCVDRMTRQVNSVGQ